MAVNLSPIGGAAAQFFDNSGNILSGGKIFTYAAGTTTPQTTYTSAGGATAHSNPIILDAAGRVPSGEIWLTDGFQYKFLIKTPADVQIGSYDNIIGINSNFVNYTNSQEFQTATAGQTVFTLTTMVYQPGTRSLSVFVDGVNQYGPGALYAYQETSDTVVTFTAGLHVGADVKFTTSAINASSYGDAQQVSYTPPFTNSVPTNVEAKLAQTISVTDFGATGNGATDDTAAIQAALAAVNTGGSVYFPTGIYRVTALLTIPDYVTVYGDSMMATKIVQDGAAFCFKLGNISFIRDMHLYGSALATGGIDIDNCGLNTIENVRVEYFNATNAVGIRLNESYRIKLSYLYIYECYTALTFTGNVTTFEFDKGNIATNNPSGKAINAPSGSGNTIEAYFNTVYFEGCYGQNPIFFAQFGRVYFTNCGFEAMCTNPAYTGIIANPAIIRANNPTNLYIQGCQFSGFLTAVQNYTGTLYYVYLGDDAPVCVFSDNYVLQNFSYAGTVLALVRVFGKGTTLTLNSNYLTGTGFSSLNEAEAVIQSGISVVYNPLNFSADNNRITVAGVTTLFQKTVMLDAAPPLDDGLSNTVITASGASTTVYTRTFPASYFGQAKTGLRITAWGQRTGTAGTKQAVLTVNAGGANSVFLSTAVTAANDWRGEAVLFWRGYNVLSINTHINDGTTSLTQTTTVTRDWLNNAGTISIVLECASLGDTMTLDGMIVERF